MKQKVSILVCLAAVAITAVAAVGCRSRTDKSAGPVVLTFGMIGPVPVVVSVGASDSAGDVNIPTFTLQSVVKDPTGTTSNLEDVELTSYQVTYRRRDTGTRVPPPLVSAFAGDVPVNSTDAISNLPILRSPQLLNPPLSDLVNFGHDTETGTAIIILDVQIQFFGNTLSGDSVASPVAAYTIEFTP
jgi:hypothetical protein